MTENIRVNLAKASKVGRLYPSRDPDSHIIVATNRMREPFAHSINVANSLILDTNRSGVLVNIELLVHPTIWEEDDWPNDFKGKFEADIVIQESTISIRDFDLPVSVYTNRYRSGIFVSISDKRFVTDHVYLSEHCFGMVHDNVLVGLCLIL